MHETSRTTRGLRPWLRMGKLALTAPVRQSNVSIDESSNIFACSFGDKGWHHIRRTLAQYDADPHICLEETALYCYLRYFTPGSICSLACDGCDVAAPLPFSAPWGSFGSYEVWTRKRPEDSRFCGPSSEEFIRDEFSRIIALYRRLSVTGYRPWKPGNGFIEGVFMLAEDGERRFVVLQGNHRMAILAHLGARRVTVRSIEGVPPVRERDVASWPHVREGRCAPDVARTVFRAFFEQNGEHVRKSIAAMRLDGPPSATGEAQR